MFNPLNYPPHNHFQLSSDHLCDGEYCLSAGLVDCLEPLCKFYGDSNSYNPQYLAITSKTMKWGNSEPNVDYAFYQYGLPTVSDFPELTKFSWDELYSQDLTNIIPKAQEFNKKYDVTIQSISSFDAPKIAQQATFTNPYTVWLVVDLNRGLGSPLYHAQALLNGSIWDSYPTNPKTNNNPIIWAYKVSLKPTNMSNVKLVKNGSEYGYYLPATNEQAMIDKANNFGYALPTINNGSQVDWNNIKVDIMVSN